MKKLGNLAGAVNAGGLVIGFGDVLKTRQQQHRIIADIAPNRHHGAGNHHHVGVGNPADMGPHRLVQDAVLAIENPAPHHGDGGGTMGRKKMVRKTPLPLILALSSMATSRDKNRPRGTVRMQK